jgi:hypothetical protein
MNPRKHPIIVKDLIQVIFKDLDPMWLKSMWDANKATCQDMIEIIFILYLVKCRI